MTGIGPVSLGPQPSALPLSYTHKTRVGVEPTPLGLQPSIVSGLTNGSFVKYL